MERYAPQLMACSVARRLEEVFKIFRKPFSFPTLKACRDHHVLEYLLPGLAHSWDSEPGRCCQKLLKARDRLLSEGRIYPSRVTGLATLLLPYLRIELGVGGTSEWWRNGPEIERFLRSPDSGVF